MKSKLRIKCPNCCYWNSVEVDKLFVEQLSSDAKVKILITCYEPLKVETCKKCKSVIAQPKELITIVKGNHHEEIIKQRETESVFV